LFPGRKKNEEKDISVVETFIPARFGKKRASVLVLVYRWLTLALVFLLFVKIRPHTIIGVSPRDAYLVFSLAVAYNLVLTWFYARVYREDLFEVALIILDCLVAGFLLYSTGGWRSPYYLYTFAPVVTAALFFGLGGALLSAVLLSLLYFTALNINGYTIQKILEMRVLDDYLANIFSYFLIGGFFAYMASLLGLLERTTARLVKTRSTLEETNVSCQLANTRLMTMQEIGMALQSTLNLDKVLGLILDSISSGLGFDRATLGFVNERENVVTDWITSATRSEKWLSEEELGRLRIPVSEEGGIVARSVLEKKPFNVTEVSADSDARSDLIAEFSPSPFAVLPMIFGGKVVGVIEADNAYSKKPISDGDLSLLTVFAGQAAAAVAHARLYKQQSKQIETLSSLYDVAATISSKLEIGEVLNSVVDQAKKVTGTEKVVLCLAKERETRFRLDEATMVVRGSRGEHPEAWWRKPMENLARKVMLTRRPQMIPHGAASAESEWLLCIPLVVRDKCMGVLCAINSRPNPFTLTDITSLTVLSRLAAVAIENAGLVAKAQRLVVAEERSRIAKEMHDGLAQSLFSVVLNLQACIQQLSTDPKGTKEKLIQLQDLASRDLKGVRQYIYELQPPDLEELGLVGAVRKYVKETAKVNALNIDFSITGRRKPLPPAVEGSLYRVTQEALSNAVKHAEAKSVSVKLSHRKGKIALSVEDDGKGFEVEKVLAASEADGGFGLRSMRERVTKLDGEFSVESQPGEGTRIRVIIPLL